MLYFEVSNNNARSILDTLSLLHKRNRKIHIGSARQCGSGKQVGTLTVIRPLVQRFYDDILVGLGTSKIFHNHHTYI